VAESNSSSPRTPLHRPLANDDRPVQLARMGRDVVIVEHPVVQTAIVPHDHVANPPEVGVGETLPTNCRVISASSAVLSAAILSIWETCTPR